MKDGKNETDRGRATTLGSRPRLQHVATPWLAKCGATSVSKQTLFHRATLICRAEQLSTPNKRNSKTYASGYLRRFTACAC